MQSRDFVYWLQGFLEIQEAGGEEGGISPGQTECIKRHLALVFKHEIDPSQGDLKHQDQLNLIHNPNSSAAPGSIQFGGTGPNGEVYRC